MFLMSTLIAGGALYAGAKICETFKKKKRNLGTLYAGKLAAEKIKPRRITLFSEDVGHQQINRNLVVATAAMGLATAGAVVYPPLSLLSVPFTLYTCIDIFKVTYKALFKEHRLRAIVLDAATVVGALATQYYVVGALNSWLYYLGQRLLLRTQDNSRKSLINVFGQQPRFVWLLRDGVEVQTPVEALRLGDMIVVNAGEMIPVDGYITDGVASIDERMLTGKAQPAEKGMGGRVFAATLVLAGHICVQVEKTGAETATAQIGPILDHTADFLSSVETKGQEIADRSVLPTLGIGALAFSTLGSVSAVAVISANFSEVLRIAAPLAMLNFLNLASRDGILVKDGRAMELLNQVDTIVFDKTGALTLEQPHVGNIYPLNGMSENDLLILAAAAETKQTHPIARAILQAANERKLLFPEIDEVQYEVGYGIKVNVADKVIRVGSARFMALEGIASPDEIRTLQEYSPEQGYSFVYVGIDDDLGGAIELHPTLRLEAKATIRKLKQRNLSTVIISGGGEKPTKKLAEELGTDRYFAEVLPEDKATLVEGLQQEGKSICFVGDGINDAIALKKAQVSISLRGVSTIATDVAQIILMDESLNQLDQAFELAQNLNANFKISLATTFGPGLLIVGGVFFLDFRILSAAIVYHLSLVSSVANAMAPWLQRQFNSGTQPAVMPQPEQDDSRNLQATNLIPILDQYATNR